MVDSGTANPGGGGPFYVVQYLIFEQATGDVRLHLAGSQGIQSAWALRMAHNIAAALDQLHGIEIAHQDVKPSNVLVFSQDASKLADLGRAWDRGQVAPHDNYLCAGDRSYSPPELLYGEIDPDYRVRRYGCDAYLLGSMIVFFCTSLSMTTYLLQKVSAPHRPNAWAGSYRSVLPYIENAFAHCMTEIESNLNIPRPQELIEVIRQLCHPDPHRRGHPKDRGGGGNPYALRRYVSIMDRLARTAELSAAGKLPIAGP